MPNLIKIHGHTLNINNIRNWGWEMAEINEENVLIFSIYDYDDNALALIRVDKFAMKYNDFLHYHKRFQSNGIKDFENGLTEKQYADLQLALTTPDSEIEIDSGTDTEDMPPAPQLSPLMASVMASSKELARS